MRFVSFGGKRYHVQNEINHVLCTANIITVQIRTSATTFCLESETKKNSLDFALPKQVKSILHEKIKKKMVDFLVFFFLFFQIRNPPYTWTQHITLLQFNSVALKFKIRISVVRILLRKLKLFYLFFLLPTLMTEQLTCFFPK